MAALKIKSGLVFVLILALAGVTYAAKSEETAQTTNTTSAVTSPTPTTVSVRNVEGEISGIDNNSISIVYKRDKGVEYEIMVPLDATVKVEHRKNIKELAVGDVVSVQFEEQTEGTGAEQKMKRSAIKINYIKTLAPEQTGE